MLASADTGRRVFTGSETVTDVRCDLDIVGRTRGRRQCGCANFEDCDPLILL
jgi:hypothetical protein